MGEHIGFDSDHWHDKTGEHYLLCRVEPWPQFGSIMAYDAGENLSVGSTFEINTVNARAKYRVTNIGEYGDYACELEFGAYEPYVRPKKLPSDFELIGKF